MKNIRVSCFTFLFGLHVKGQKILNISVQNAEYF